MEFKKNTSPSRLKNLIKYIIIFLLLSFISIFLINKINFPSPNKDIEKVISNEKFKIVK
ncbi:hypothetical protein OAH88_04965 [Candidatus Pelagibacter sp.]|jgi:hypothetical protein|nr:hypothetical protein [Candidatus Pelagibacter sp.]